LSKGGEVGEVEEQFRVDWTLALQWLDPDSASGHHAQRRRGLGSRPDTEVAYDQTRRGCVQSGSDVH
jgi:hypothetical protein